MTVTVNSWWLDYRQGYRNGKGITGIVSFLGKFRWKKVDRITSLWVATTLYIVINKEKLITHKVTYLYGVEQITKWSTTCRHSKDQKLIICITTIFVNGCSETQLYKNKENPWVDSHLIDPVHHSDVNRKILFRFDKRLTYKVKDKGSLLNPQGQKDVRKVVNINRQKK